MATVGLFSLFTVFALLSATALAEIRFMEIRSDGRSIIPFEEFGFTHTGHLQLNLSKLSISKVSDPKPDLSRVGFFLCTRDSWIHVLEQVANNDITCPFESTLIKPVLTFDKLQTLDHYETSFNEPDANQFTLVFCNCVPDLKVSMAVHSSMYNLDPKTNLRDYLSAGRTNLPSIYFTFFLVYSSLAGIWIYVLYNKRLSAFRIQYFMLAVLIMKALNLLCETEDKSYIMRTGAAHGWEVLSYIFSFLKGITLFNLIVLIGTGWSFLQDKEKKVLMIVIPLQVIANVAIYALETITSYRYRWTSVVAAELATLAFYVFTGYNFRPKVHDPYFAIDDEELEAAAEELNKLGR